VYNIVHFSVRFTRWPLSCEMLRTQIVYAFVAVPLRSAYSEHPCVGFDDANTCLFFTVGISLYAVCKQCSVLAYHHPSIILFPSSGRYFAFAPVNFAFCT
jgi:hypothetical protein